MQKPIECTWCNARVVTCDGRLPQHVQGPSPWAELFGVTPGAPCPLSGTVPWRRGTPDLETVRRHLQSHPSFEEDVGVAHFQTRWMGMFHGILSAGIERVDGVGVVQWGYGFARDGKDEWHGGFITPPAADVSPATAWDFRPLDLATGEARPWIDAAEEG